MITLKIEHVDVTVQVVDDGKLNEILALLTQHTRLLKEIRMDDAQLKELLSKVDVTTTKIGTNVDTIAGVQQTEADVIQTISNEVDALVAAGQAAGISPEAAAKLQDIADRLQGSSDRSDLVVTALQAQVPVLQGIAAKGAPVVPPPPPTPQV